MTPDGVEPHRQARHGFDHQAFGGTKVHDDAGVGCVRRQTLKQIQNCGNGRSEDDNIRFGEQTGRVAVSLVHDVL